MTKALEPDIRVLRAQIREYNSKKEKIKKLQEEVRTLGNEIKEYFVDNSLRKMEFSSYTACVYDSSRYVFDSKKFKEEQPDLYQDYIYYSQSIGIRVERMSK